MLNSASSNESGIPQQLLEAKQKELQERREREATIQVRADVTLTSAGTMLEYVDQAARGTPL